MATDLSSFGRAFQGFIEASQPLKIKQTIDALIAGDEKSEDDESSSSTSQEDSKTETDDEGHVGKTVVDRLLDLKKIFPFFGKKKEAKKRKQKYVPVQQTATEDEERTTDKSSETDKPEVPPKKASSSEKTLSSLESLESQEQVAQRRKSYRPTLNKNISTDEQKSHSKSLSSTVISDKTRDDEISSDDYSAYSISSEIDQDQELVDAQTVRSSVSEEGVVIDISDEEREISPGQFQATEIKSYRKRTKGIGKCFFLLCPCFAKLLYSKRTEYRGIKAMLGFPIGILFGYALHKLVLERLQMSPFASQALGNILALCLGIGYALSSQVRCICCLTIPTLCGKTGRMYLSTFIITFIILGPIANITSNARESMRVMTCIGSLNLNHTVERFKLMFKPVKEIIWDFVGASEKIQRDTKGIESAYKEIDEEVQDEEEVKVEISETDELDKEIGQESRVDTIKKKFTGVKRKFGSNTESKYGMKTEFRCEAIFTRAVKGCYKSFAAAYDRCHYYLPLIGYLLCWPMKLTFICDLASSFLGRRSCDSSNAMSPGFGESMETAEGVQREFDKEFGVSMQYKIDIPPEQVDQITPQDISASIQHEFEKRKRSLDFFLNMIIRLLAFTFLQVFNASRKYCDQYLKSIEFDNKYITSYFRHIDARRRKQGKKTLLPLQKGEKIELTEPFKVKFSKEEKRVIILSTLRLIGELMTVSIILAFDWIFYEFLMLIQRHANVTYYQTGVHHIKMTIYGDGFIGNLVRSILKGFDKKHTTDEVTSTAACLPQPTKLELWAVISIYGMFLLIFLLMIFQSYSKRIRRVICSFFYPKREKKRILFLYNDRLKKRKSYMKYMRHRIRKMARQQAIALESGVFFSLRHLYPKYFGWLEKIGFGKRKCLVCEEVESRKIPFVICSEECPFCYCPECWADMKGKCYVCLPDDDDSPLSDDDFSDDKDE